MRFSSITTAAQPRAGRWHLVTERCHVIACFSSYILHYTPCSPLHERDRAACFSDHRARNICISCPADLQANHSPAEGFDARPMTPQQHSTPPYSILRGVRTQRRLLSLLLTPPSSAAPLHIDTLEAAHRDAIQLRHSPHQRHRATVVIVYVSDTLLAVPSMGHRYWWAGLDCLQM